MLRSLLASLVLCSALLLPASALAADDPVMTLDVLITSGKASLAAEKREVKKLRIEVVVGGAATQLEDRLAVPATITTVDGDLTELVPVGVKLNVTARAAGGGAALLYVSLDDTVAVPLPIGGITATGVKAKSAVRGLAIDTVVAVAIKQDAVVELAALEDPVADRTWLVAIRVSAVKGTPRMSGTAPLNSWFVARIEEGADKAATTTIARVAVAPDSTGRVVDEISVPMARDTTDRGRQIDLIPFAVGLNASTAGNSWAIEVGTARVRAAAAGKEGSLQQRNASRVVSLTPGAGATELGSLSDGAGKNVFRATVEIARRE